MKIFPALTVLVLAHAANAQQSGDNILLAGWIHVHAMHTRTTLHTDLRPSLIGQVLGISDSFDSPGTSASLSSIDTLGISSAHFFTDHLAVTFNGGIPSKVSVRGHGVVAPSGLAGQLFNVDLGDPSVNPLGSARQWSPALMFQYHFGARTARLRPFVGLGFTYTWFTQVKLNPAFERELNMRVGRDLALAAGKPGSTSVSIDAPPLWEPVFGAGLPFKLNRHWGVTASMAYVPFITTATVRIKAADGTVLSTSRPRINVDALITGLLLSYRF